MPVTRLLDQKHIDILTLWIMNGMPRTAEGAAKLSPTPVPGNTPLPVPTPTPKKRIQKPASFELTGFFVFSLER
jgi:hypothetical protein